MIRHGDRESDHCLARKFRGIVYRTLKNRWLFQDFPNFVLAEDAMTIAAYASATLSMASLQLRRLYAQWYVASQNPRLRTSE